MSTLIHGIPASVDALKRIADLALKKNVTLGRKAMNRYESHPLNTASRALAMLDKVGALNVVGYLETYHMNIEESHFIQPVLVCGKRLGYASLDRPGQTSRGHTRA